VVASPVASWATKQTYLREVGIDGMTSVLAMTIISDRQVSKRKALHSSYIASVIDIIPLTL